MYFSVVLICQYISVFPLLLFGTCGGICICFAQAMKDAGAIFDGLDICKDGAVTLGELELVDILNHHLPLDIDHSDARVQKLFGELDLDKNNTISKEEFVHKSVLKLFIQNDAKLL